VFNNILSKKKKAVLVWTAFFYSIKKNEEYNTMIYKLFITAVILFGFNSFTFCFENSFKKTPKEHPFLIDRRYYNNEK